MAPCRWAERPARPRTSIERSSLENARNCCRIAARHRAEECMASKKPATQAGEAGASHRSAPLAGGLCHAGLALSAYVLGLQRVRCAPRRWLPSGGGPGLPRVRPLPSGVVPLAQADRIPTLLLPHRPQRGMPRRAHGTPAPDGQPGAFGKPLQGAADRAQPRGHHCPYAGRSQAWSCSASDHVGFPYPDCAGAPRSAAGGRCGTGRVQNAGPSRSRATPLAARALS